MAYYPDPTRWESFVCSQCGEVYYSDDVAEKLEEIVNRFQVMVKDIAIFECDKVVKAA